MEKNTNNSIDYLSSLKYPDFLKMWLAGLFAGSSHWALIVVRGWVVYQISDSSMYVGLVTFAALIPMVIVNPFIGYLADKFQRRRILQIMFFINFAHNLGLAFFSIGEYKKSLLHLKKSVRIDPNISTFLITLLFDLNYSPDMSAEEIFEYYKQYDKQFGLPHKMLNRY